MKRKLKIIALILTGLVLLFVLTGVVIGTVYQDEVKLAVMRELKQKLTRNILVNEKDIHFSMFSKFPNASVEINNITIPGIKKGAPNLLKVEKLYLLFNMFSVFTNNFEIHAVDLQKGELNIGYEEGNKANFYIWRESKEEEESNVKINLTLLNIDHISFSYFNQDEDGKYSFLLEKIDFYPYFNESNLSFASEGDLVLQKLENSDFTFSKEIAITHTLRGGNFNYNTGLFKLREVELELENEITLKGNGSIHDKKDGVWFDLRCQGEKVEIKEILPLLPASYLEKISPLKPNGKVDFSIAVTNKSDVSRSPDIKVNFGFNPLQFTLPEENIELDNLQLKGQYMFSGNNVVNPHTVELQEFLLRFGESSIKGTLAVSELKNPVIKLKGEANLLLQDLQEKIKHKNIEDITGTVHANFDFKGKLAEIFLYKNVNYLPFLKSDGELLFTNVNVKLQEDPNQYKNIRGKISFNNRDFAVDSLAGMANSTDFFIQGKITDVYHFLLTDSPFKMSAYVQSNNFNMNEFLSESESATNNDYKLNFADNTQMNLRFKVNKFVFRKFEAANVNGAAKVEGKQLNLNEFICSTADGKAQINATLNAEKSNRIMFDVSAALEKINVKKLFAQFENFSQEFLTDKHIEGILTSNLFFKAETDSLLNINDASIYTLAHVKIDNGRLLEMPSMVELEDFLSKEYNLKFNDLSHLSFSTLENDIRIENRIIYIPEMTINSSALKIDISGTHTFDMAIDYRFKIKSSELMKALKNKKKDSEFVEQEDNTGQTLPFYMRGTTENPSFGYDREAKKEIVNTRVDQEKQRFKDAFKNEFGKKDNPKKEVKEEDFKEEVKDEKKQNSNNEKRFDVQWDD